MVDVPTLLGAISPDDLGVVSLSEHLLYGLPGWQHAPEVIFDRVIAFEEICSSLEQFKKLGGNTIVDAGGMTLGRDVPFYSKIAEETSVNILASTGFDDRPTSIPGHFFVVPYAYNLAPESKAWRKEIPGSFYPSHAGTKDYLMYLFYDELTKGMVAPGMIRTKTRAAIVRAATSQDQMKGLQGNPLDIEEKSLRGAASAAKRTGVTLMVNHAGQEEHQLKSILDEGLEPDRVIFGHRDDGRSIDLQQDRELALRGAYVAYDHIGWEDKSLPHCVSDEQRVEQVKAMVDSGFTEHIILSCNAIGYALGVPQPGHSFSHLLKSFLPRLKKAGVSNNAIDTILRENPKRILTRKEVPGRA